jgi:hypothetical protein
MRQTGGGSAVIELLLLLAVGGGAACAALAVAFAPERRVTGAPDRPAADQPVDR